MDVTVSLDQASMAALDKLATGLDRSREWVVARAVQRYVEEESEFMAFVQEGLDDLDAGRVLTQEEVEAMFEVRRETRDAA